MTTSRAGGFQNTKNPRRAFARSVGIAVYFFFFVFFTAVLFACFGALFFCAVVGFDAFAVLGDVSAVSAVVHKYQFEQL